VEPDFTSLLDRLTGQLEEPFADTSVIPTYYVSELARQHVKVALSGDGGDELFAGYDRYAAYQRRSRLDHLPAWLGQAYQRGVYPRLPRSWQQRKLASNLTLPAPERYLDGLSLLEVRGRHQSLFTPDFVAAAARGAHPLEAFRAALHHAPAGDPISRLLYLDTKTYLAGDILTKVDRMSMAVSLEARVPILDHLFVEWVTSLPLDWKLRGGARKYILRQLAGRLGVPHAALARRKRGFTPPLRHWLRSELRDEFVRILLEPRTLQRGYLQAAGVRQLLDAHLQGRFDHSDVLWQLLVFELWHRNFVEGRQPGS
jgi:asparagine synthase (glutamine-hydrolysing)